MKYNLHVLKLLLIEVKLIFSLLLHINVHSMYKTEQGFHNFQNKTGPGWLSELGRWIT